MNNTPHELTMDTERNEYFKIISQLIERIVYLDDMAEHYKHEAEDFEVDFLAAEDARLDLQKKLDAQRDVSKIDTVRIEELKKKLKDRDEDVNVLIEVREYQIDAIHKMVDFAKLHREEIEKALTPFDFLVFCECFNLCADREDPGDADCDPWAIPDEEFFEDDEEDDDKDGGFF